MQFYFLSVFFNMLIGLSLTFSGFKFAELFPGKEKIVKMNSEAYQLGQEAMTAVL